VLVRDDRVGRAGGLDEWTGKLAASMFQRDADDFEVVILMSLIEALPPGQLFAASSPGSPEEEQEPLSAHLSQFQFPTAQQGQRKVGNGIANACGGLGLYHCYDSITLSIVVSLSVQHSERPIISPVQAHHVEALHGRHALR
jgi:hypothetical protein